MIKTEILPAKTSSALYNVISVARVDNKMIKALGSAASKLIILQRGDR